MRTLTFAALPFALSACVAVTDNDTGTIEQRPIGGSGACEAEDAAEFIGRRATAEIGANIMRETGAGSLRWGPPGAVFTMDYRPDRVNVMYDQDMIITEIRCG